MHDVVTKKRLAILGSEPSFQEPIPVGQLYFPAWERYQQAMEGIFEREYYINNGPLHEKLERSLEEFLGVKHVICVLNATLGLMMLTDALALRRKVVVPSFTFPATIQALMWAGVEPVLCDVDRDNHHLSFDELETLLKDDDVEGILAVNLWGDCIDIHQLEHIANQYNKKLFFDSAQCFGCQYDNKSIGNFGHAEVLSFHATKILSATEGGCICTNDDDLAARLRESRPSYYPSADTQVPIKRVTNARMSEMQAAIALMSLEDFAVNRDNNKQLYLAYKASLMGISGITLKSHQYVSQSNYQYAVIMVDEASYGLSRDDLIEVLHAENVIARRYFYPGFHKSKPYEYTYQAYQDDLQNTDYLNQTCIQLPLGSLVDVEKVKHISSIIERASRVSSEIKTMLPKV